MDKHQKKKKPKAVKIILNTLATIGVVLLAVVMVLVGVCFAVFRGPSESARNLAIKSLDETSAMKWLSSLFLPRDVIDSVLNPQSSSEKTSESSDNVINLNFGANTKLINVTIDIGISLRIDLRENMTVKNISVSDHLEGFDIEKLEGKSFEDMCVLFLSALESNNIIEEGKNDALLIGTIADNDDISSELDKTISNIIKDKELPVSVLSLYTLSKDNGIETLSSNLNLSYNKVKLCNLISNGDSSVFYYLSMFNLTEILSYCNKNNIDIKTLVNEANVKEQELIPPKTELEEDDEWADYPDGIKIVSVKGETFNGRIMIIKDPTKVYTATSSPTFSPNKAGIGIDKKIASEGAIAGINGGFFVDYVKYQGEYVYNGSIPFGTVVSNGKHVFTNNTYIYKGFVGFTEDDVLIAFDRFITQDDIDKYKIRDGVCCSPVLIQNGEPVDYADFGEAESLNPRTAIGQRADGAVLFLTIDGRIPNSLGASCQDVIDVMLEFGAVTAANLDGGASSAMYYLDTYGRYGDSGKYVLMNTRSVLYNPRGIPTYFMVKP